MKFSNRPRGVDLSVYHRLADSRVLSQLNQPIFKSIITHQTAVRCRDIGILTKQQFLSQNIPNALKTCVWSGPTQTRVDIRNYKIKLP